MSMNLENLTKDIADELIREGIVAAISNTLLPAAVEKAYPGHFTVTADGSYFGAENTWPGLDSWEMAGAYLLMGQSRLVLDYFDFVQASQRTDGNIPFAIFPAEPPPDSSRHLRGMRYPDDVYTYAPVPREGQREFSNMDPRKWIGLFDHYQLRANPFSVLGPISYILTAWEIARFMQSHEWIAQKLGSVELAGRYLLSRRSGNGLISGAGFYLERPPRNQWDGITQCYTCRALRMLAEMNASLGRLEASDYWAGEADAIANVFRDVFWRVDHFAEYVHPDHGLVDLHGLTDVNWAAVALDVATEQQARALWPLMLAEESFWFGGMPTQLVSKPYAYQDWELGEPLPFVDSKGPLYDVSAMGRVWYLEALACLKMGELERVRESVRQVCLMGKRHGWLWHERYLPMQTKDVFPAGPRGYCEYAAILVRIVLGNPDVFKERG